MSPWRPLFALVSWFCILKPLQHIWWSVTRRCHLCVPHLQRRCWDLTWTGDKIVAPAMSAWKLVFYWEKGPWCLIGAWSRQIEILFECRLVILRGMGRRRCWRTILWVTMTMIDVQRKHDELRYQYDHERTISGQNKSLSLPNLQILCSQCNDCHHRMILMLRRNYERLCKN